MSRTELDMTNVFVMVTCIYRSYHDKHITLGNLTFLQHDTTYVRTYVLAEKWTWISCLARMHSAIHVYSHTGLFVVHVNCPRYAVEPL